MLFTFLINVLKIIVYFHYKWKFKFLFKRCKGLFLLIELMLQQAFTLSKSMHSRGKSTLRNIINQSICSPWDIVLWNGKVGPKQCPILSKSICFWDEGRNVDEGFETQLLEKQNWNIKHHPLPRLLNQHILWHLCISTDMKHFRSMLN